MRRRIFESLCCFCAAVSAADVALSFKYEDQLVTECWFEKPAEQNPLMLHIMQHCGMPAAMFLRGAMSSVAAVSLLLLERYRFKTASALLVVWSTQQVALAAYFVL